MVHLLRESHLAVVLWDPCCSHGVLEDGLGLEILVDFVASYPSWLHFIQNWMLSCMHLMSILDLIDQSIKLFEASNMIP